MARPAQSLVTVSTELPQDKKKCWKCWENFAYLSKYSAVFTVITVRYTVPSLTEIGQEI